MKLETILSIMLECLGMLYYCNTLFTPKYSKKLAYAVIVICYIFLIFISAFTIPIMNIISFYILNFLIIFFLFKEKPVNALFHTTILSVMMMLSEFFMAMIFGFQLNGKTSITVQPELFMLHGIVSKAIYLIELIILRYLYSNKKTKKNMNGFIRLFIMPVSTIYYIILVNDVMPDFAYETRLMFLFSVFLMIVANFIVYWTYDSYLTKNIELQELKETAHKNELIHKGYQLRNDKYELLQTLTHNFQNYTSVMEKLAIPDNAESAKLLESINRLGNEIIITTYTDHKIFNVLLSEKLTECNNKKIQTNIYIQKPDLNFMDELDIVSIFSNIWDNAIESCMKSEKKTILFKLDYMNESFLVVNVINSCDQKPVSVNGKLKTDKKDKNAHGLGMKSIEKTLDRYKGAVQWEYDSPNKDFQLTVVIPVPIKNQVTDAVHF